MLSLTSILLLYTCHPSFSSFASSLCSMFVFIYFYFVLLLFFCSCSAKRQEHMFHDNLMLNGLHPLCLFFVFGSWTCPTCLVGVSLCEALFFYCEAKRVLSCAILRSRSRYCEAISARCEAQPVLAKQSGLTTLAKRCVKLRSCCVMRSYCSVAGWTFAKLNSNLRSALCECEASFAAGDTRNSITLVLKC